MTPFCHKRVSGPLEPRISSFTFKGTGVLRRGHLAICGANSLRNFKERPVSAEPSCPLGLSQWHGACHSMLGELRGGRGSQPEMKGAQVGRLYPRTSVWLFAAQSQLGDKLWHVCSGTLVTPGMCLCGTGHGQQSVQFQRTSVEPSNLL